MKIPILAANMESVIGPTLAEVLIEAGSIPILHRFQPLNDQIMTIKQFPNKCFMSCGVKESISDVLEVYDAGALGIVIDISHGHSIMMVERIEEIKKLRPEIEIIAGNVCTAQATQDLIVAGCSAVKVNIGSGSICSTRLATAFGNATFSSILECAAAANIFGVPIIADGGIKTSADIVKALCAGASSVMIGKLFASTDEANCQREGRNYRGQASKSFMTDFYAPGEKIGVAPEGEDFFVKGTGSARDLIETLAGGLRSGLTYAGAMNLQELRDKAKFVRVAPGYILESRIRPD